MESIWNNERDYLGCHVDQRYRWNTGVEEILVKKTSTGLENSGEPENAIWHATGEKKPFMETDDDNDEEEENEDSQGSFVMFKILLKVLSWNSFETC